MPTTRPTTTTCAWCVAEREPAGTGGGNPPPPRDPFSLGALWRAYRACRRGKRKARDTQRYEARLLDRLVSTRDALASFGWRPSRNLAFVVSAPKQREIHAAPFGDRVVHHLLVTRLERLYEPVFIHDSYANRHGKGTHAAVDRLQIFMRQASHGGARPACALQLDIANCFNSIHRPTLFRLIQHRLVRAVRRQGLDRDEARALQAHCRALLVADPTAGVRRQGPPARFNQVPPHKRLGALGPGIGLPIGNLTSQFFANVYLNELDQFIKHTLKVRWYVRYVDDFVLLHPDPEQLLAWRAAIEQFLAERLRLRLKAQTEPRPLTQGVDFLGYLVRPHYRLVRRRVVRRCHRRLAEFERRHVRPNALRLIPAERDLLRARVASYRGHFRHAHSHRLWQRTLARFPWLNHVFDPPRIGAKAPPTPMRPGRSGLGRDNACQTPLRPAWEPASVTSLANQYRAFTRRYPEACVLMEVGNRWLVAGEYAARLARQVSGVITRRPGLGRCLELPRQWLAEARKRLKRASVPHVLVAQTGHFRTGFKRRATVLIWRPVPDPQHPFLAPSSRPGDSP